MLPDSRWIVMGEPVTPAEDKALQKVREVLPDDGVTTAWANLTFIDGNGRSAEIDVLLLSPAGFFVVELKGWHGTISGTSQRWYHGKRNVENPWLLTDRKAKRLSSLLKSYAPSPAAAKTLPFVKALVVLHGHGSTVKVDDHGLANVLRLDDYDVKTQKPQKPLQTLSQFVDALPGNPHHRIDGVQAKQVRALCDKAGFRKTPKVRMVGDFEVASSTPIAEGPDWHDVLVQLPAMPSIKRRLRLYDVPPKAPTSERTRIEQLAQREFQLTYGISNDGIAAPVDFKKTDDGPALVFDHDDASTPLSDYLAADGANLTMEERVGLITRLGEILRYAHQRHLLHRALAPARIWVTPRKRGLPRVTIRDWYFGQKDRSTDATSRWTAISGGLSDLMGASNQEDWLYLAPEARQNATELPGVPLDVYGFGALAYLILTGTAPAATFAELEQVHAELGGLDPRRAAQGVPDDLAVAVTLATSVVESDRPATIDEVLGLVRDAWDEVRRQAVDEIRTPVVDPLDAQTADMIADRFLVSRRRGEGSSGVALAVLDDTVGDAAGRDRELILKVARTDVAARALDNEAQILKGLDHKRVVRLLEGPLDLDGRRGLLLSDAGPETLAARLTTEGRATLGQLERFGSELLEAMSYLDGKGVFHRDIKPANLGIREDPGTRRPTLVLFDFSLATEPVENLRSGTTGYLDPFLGRGRRTVYDRAAEIYAVSATLFEMATGQLPWWGQGAGVPAHASDAPVVDRGSFEQAVAVPLTALFRRALSPDAKDRFGTVDELAVAWHEAFASLDAADDTTGADDARAARATAETLLEQSGLSARALSALARLDEAVTVGDLLGIHPMRVNSIRGLGEKYRKEIQGRIRQWRERLRAPARTSDDDASGTERVVEGLLGRLDGDTTVVRTVLGLADGARNPALTWPTPAEAGQQLGLTREQVNSEIEAAVVTWTSTPAGQGSVLDAVHAEVLHILADAGRIMTVPELATALAAQRGSLLEGPARVGQGRALLRAVYELDLRMPKPALNLRRRSQGRDPLLALTESVLAEDLDAPAPTADELGDLAIDLGRQADDLVRDGVIGHVPAARALRAVLGETLGDAYLPDHRLLRLAASASDNAAVSGFEELYPRNLEVRIALEHALRGKPGRSLSVEAVRRSVSARFPEVRLPRTQARLDELVAKVLPGVRNVDGRYETPGSHRASTATGISLTTHGGAGTPDADVARKLADSFSRHAALTLAVDPRRYVRASHIIASGYAGRGLEVLDVGSLLVQATKALAEREGIDWSFVVGVDGLDRGTADWATLEALVRDAVRPCWEEELARPVPLLVTNAGPLVRYGMTPLLAQFLDVGTARPATRWLLIAKSADQPAPVLEGTSVPVGPSGWLTLPSDPAALAAVAPLEIPGAPQ